MDLSDKNISLQRASKHVHKSGYKYPIEKRIEVVTKWLALGNMRVVSEVSGVSYQLCRMWKQEPWWEEIVAEVKASRSIALDNKLSKIVDRSLEMIEDRLVNGDFVFNQKTGAVVRKEVSLKDASKVATDLLTRQAALQKQESEVTTQQSTATVKDQLALLAAEFSKFNKRNTGPVEDAIIVEQEDAVHEERPEDGEVGEGLRHRGKGIHQSSRSEEEEGSTESSPQGDDGSRTGEER